MKCVCVKQCQARNDRGVIIFYDVGQVAEFKKCPTHFRPIEGKKAKPVNFMTASEEELREAKFSDSDLKKFIEETYGRRTGNRGRDKMIDMLLDCRFRALDIDPNDMV